MEIRAHTGLHIIKGAARKVLGDDAKWTAGVHVSENRGRLNLQFDRKPSDEEIKQIEIEANALVQLNLPVITYNMTQMDARERFGDEHLDIFPIPESIKTITVVEIKEWNINACNKPHTKTTGEVGVIKIRKIRFRKMKERLEISFMIEPNG
ncbi:MAG: alanyl-tRNA editing protein [Promethearchaeota archaeon]